MIAPFLPFVIPAVLLALLAYVHHDGDTRGYARRAAEVRAAVEAADARVRQADNQWSQKYESDMKAREAVFKTIVDSGDVCVVPPDTVAKLNRIK